ncbi:hypothetical protein [Trinickia sp. Y13]|uniref:AraC-like ligand-binding domain-containing protein n=1 Tax=Trinickia sp. Y13 TaxID=2917807 RepID=UPI002405832F|nr:hypothetical protein [Trinickia sp. Y13]MDG0022811.1 hypothetical protein [Trinickia sp. Y13]
MSTTVTFSTDDVRQCERFDFWRDAMCSHFYGMTFDLERRKRSAFQASLTAKSIGETALVDLRASACVIHRLDKQIEAAPGNALFLYRQAAGAAWIEAVDRRHRFVVETSTLAMGDSDLPFATAPTDGHEFNCTILKIPFARIDPWADPTVQYSAQGVQPSAGIGALLTAYFDAFCREIDYLDSKAADAALQTLAQLTAAARDTASSVTDRGRDAVLAARRQMVREFIECNLHRADLTPAMTVRALGISVFIVHFAPRSVWRQPNCGNPSKTMIDRESIPFFMRCKYQKIAEPG